MSLFFVFTHPLNTMLYKSIHDSSSYELEVLPQCLCTSHPPTIVFNMGVSYRAFILTFSFILKIISQPDGPRYQAN